MASWRPMSIGSKCYQPRSRTQSIERLVNAYVQASQESGKTQYTVYGSPGLLAWATVGAGPIRGLHVFGSDVYVASGANLYAVASSSLMITDLGPIGGSGSVRMVNNGEHVVVAASSGTWAVNRSDFIPLSVSNVSSLMYQDGYVIFIERDTQSFWLSDLDDATTIGGLNFSTADAFADNLVGGINHKRELFLMGQKSTENWYNSGAADFPFVRSGGGVVERGAASPGSICIADGLIYFLGNDRRVYRMDGYQPTVVSTPDIDRLIHDAASSSSAEAFSYTLEGHTVYVLGFSNLTLLYDTTTQRWHERKSYGLDRWRAQHHCYIGGKNLVGHYENGQVYELSLSTYDEDGEPLVRELISPPFSAGARPVFVHEIALDFEAGVGLTSGQGSDPVVMLSWSDDDGVTWSSDIESGLGAIGVRRYRANFVCLGMSRNRSWRFRVSDPVRFAFLGAEARYDVGSA